MFTIMSPFIIFLIFRKLLQLEKQSLTYSHLTVWLHSQSYTHSHPEANQYYGLFD